MISLKLNSKEKENLREEDFEIAMARKLEILILPYLRRNLHFFYAGGNLKEKANAYKMKQNKEDLERIINEGNNEKISTVCKPLCEMVTEILQKNGIKAETVSCDTDMFKHTDVLIETREGKKYIINYLEDMESIQTGMKTPDFASKKYYERRYQKFENGLTTDGKDLQGISFLSEEDLDRIDATLGYKKCNMYMNEVIHQIKTEFKNFKIIMLENEFANIEKNIKTKSKEEQEQIKKGIYQKYKNMTEKEELEEKLNWVFNYFNDRLDINGHTDFVMYYSKLLLKEILSEEEYAKLTRYDGFVNKNNISKSGKIREILDFDNTENESKYRFCVVKIDDISYVFSTKPNSYIKLNNEEFEKLRQYANLTKSEKPSDLMLYLCDRGNALPLVFHPLGAQILNERANEIDKNLNDEERKQAIKDLSNQIITTDEPITSILIPYEDGKEKYLYINKDNEFVVKEYNSEIIYHYDENTDTFIEEIVSDLKENKER